MTDQTTDLTVADAWAARDAVVAERKRWLTARAQSERAAVPMDDAEAARVLGLIEAETAAIQRAAEVERRVHAEKMRALAEKKRELTEAIARREAYIRECADLGCRLLERARRVLPADCDFHTRDGQRTFSAAELSRQEMHEVCFALFMESQVTNDALTVRIARGIAGALELTTAELARRHAPGWARAKLRGADSTTLSRLVLDHLDLDAYDFAQMLRIGINIADALSTRCEDLQ